MLMATTDQKLWPIYHVSLLRTYSKLARYFQRPFKGVGAMNDYQSTLLFREEYDGSRECVRKFFLCPLLGQSFVHKSHQHGGCPMDRKEVLSQQLCSGQCMMYSDFWIRTGSQDITISLRYWRKSFCDINKENVILQQPYKMVFDLCDDILYLLTVHNTRQ